ncbi:MAG: sodium:proton antiporter [Proteobacteria bacterium]|nr:sodium:proton antiporter [Pseudomonadota bacterium]
MDGENLSFYWGIPFLGVLFSLSLGPYVCSKFWHDHSGKVLGLWTLALIIGLKSFSEISIFEKIIETLFHHYFPFIIFLGTLYILSGGIWVKTEFQASPFKNTCFLMIGTFFASIIGTTGALLIFIKPFLNVNKERISKKHLVIFLIILVGNIGGSLTPLGDPPLFLGYLKGIDFFWVPKNLSGPFFMMMLPLLGLFYGIDYFYWKKERLDLRSFEKGNFTFHLKGHINFLFLGGVILLLLASKRWENFGFITVFNISITISALLRDGGLLFLSLLSWIMTPKIYRLHNKFSWAPLCDIAKVFLSLFIILIPVFILLETKVNFMELFQVFGFSEKQNMAPFYFWSTGLLSAFLDNAPTYLVFLKTTGMNVKMLMVEGSKNLLAISCGAVFMGALTYIGNAPNFLAKDIAEEEHIEMPGFFNYMAWVSLILLPLLGCVTFFFLY